MKTPLVRPRFDDVEGVDDVEGDGAPLGSRGVPYVLRFPQPETGVVVVVVVGSVSSCIARLARDHDAGR